MKVALVTGGSRGIGAQIAKELSERGWEVAICASKSIDSAQELASSLASCKAYKADISDPAQVNELFSKVSDDFGRIDLLVNNAGIAHIGLLQDMSDVEIQRLVSVDLLGSIYCCREAIKRMVPNHSGNIINISSLWGEVGASCEAVYSACKAGVIGLTKALAKEVGPAGIQVNCISPGLIATEMNACLDEETKSALCEETPLQRIGTVSDVAKAVAFLASEDSSFITGQVISVNGGMII